MQYEQVLSDIGEATFKMLELAQTKQWDDVAVLENKRTNLFTLLEELCPSLNNDATNRKQLIDVIEINKLIITLARQEKQECQAEVQHIKRCEKAQKAYAGF